MNAEEYLIGLDDSDFLEHHGVKGMKWGVRRYQNKDGSLTEAGKKRYYTKEGHLTEKGQKHYNDLESKYYKLTDYGRASSRKIKKADKKYGKYLKGIEAESVFTKNQNNPVTKDQQKEFMNRFRKEAKRNPKKAGKMYTDFISQYPASLFYTETRTVNSYDSKTGQHIKLMKLSKTTNVSKYRTLKRDVYGKPEVTTVPKNLLDDYGYLPDKVKKRRGKNIVSSRHIEYN